MSHNPTQWTPEWAEGMRRAEHRVDILLSSLSNLSIGQELIMTARSFNNVANRYDRFKGSTEMRFKVIKGRESHLRRIRRLK